MTVLAHPVDRFLLMRGAQLMRRAAFSADMNDFVEAEAEPGLATEADDEFAEWVKSNIRHEYHPIVSRPRRCPRRSACVPRRVR